MKRGDIFSALCAVAVCAILPIVSVAEPAPKNGDYKMISVSVAGHQELLCHRYMTGTDVNGHKYGFWSPTLQHFDPHCSQPHATPSGQYAATKAKQTPEVLPSTGYVVQYGRFTKRTCGAGNLVAILDESNPLGFQMTTTPCTKRPGTENY